MTKIKNFTALKALPSHRNVNVTYQRIKTKETLHHSLVWWTLHIDVKKRKKEENKDAPFS